MTFASHISPEHITRKQAQAGDSMRHLLDIRRGVTDERTDGRTDRQALL